MNVLSTVVIATFRVDSGQDRWLTIEQARHILASLQQQDVCEILILSGEVHPQSPRRSVWFDRLYDLCTLALEMGFLPHTNAGILSFTEMQKLGTVNVSMGLMLEALDPVLLQGVHRHAPSKLPRTAIRTTTLGWRIKNSFHYWIIIRDRGRSQDWSMSLHAIASIHDRWGHIQEVILQPYSPGTQKLYRLLGFDITTLPQVIRLARAILPREITIQIPTQLNPNSPIINRLFRSRCEGFGGISPKDEDNPDYYHSDLSELRYLLASNGWQLTTRLPVYRNTING